MQGGVGADLFHRELGSQVAAGNHGAVHRVQDVLQVAHAVRALDLGQDADGGPCASTFPHQNIPVSELCSTCVQWKGLLLSTVHAPYSFVW